MSLGRPIPPLDPLFADVHHCAPAELLHPGHHVMEPDRWTRVEDLHPGWWLARKEPIIIDEVRPPRYGRGHYVIYWRFAVNPDRRWFYEAPQGCSFLLDDDTDEVPI